MTRRVDAGKDRKFADRHCRAERPRGFEVQLSRRHAGLDAFADMKAGGDVLERIQHHRSVRDRAGVHARFDQMRIAIENDAEDRLRLACRFPLRTDPGFPSRSDPA